MYCTITYNPSLNPFRSNGTAPDPDKILYVNPDCRLKILLEHIRNSAEIDAEQEYDLCTMSGDLQLIHTYDDYLYATTILVPYANYICVLIERNSEENISKLIPLTAQKNNNLTIKLRRYLNPSKRFSYDLKQKSRKSIADKSSKSPESKIKSDISFNKSKSSK